jgi:hypothetical protein
MQITQNFILADVKPGMLVSHNGKTYRASANTNGKLYLFNLTERKRITDEFVKVFLNARNEPAVN